MLQLDYSKSFKIAWRVVECSLDTNREDLSMKKSKWGLFFIVPYFIVYLIFTALPIVISLYKSVFVNYWKGLIEVGPFFFILLLGEL